MPRKAKIRYRLPCKGAKPDSLFPKEQLNLLKAVSRSVEVRENWVRNIQRARRDRTDVKNALRQRESRLSECLDGLDKSNKELEKLRLDLIILLTGKRFYSKEQESKRRKEMQAERQKEREKRTHAAIDELESRDVI